MARIVVKVMRRLLRSCLCSLLFSGRCLIVRGDRLSYGLFDRRSFRDLRRSFVFSVMKEDELEGNHPPSILRRRPVSFRWPESSSSILPPIGFSRDDVGFAEMTIEI